MWMHAAARCKASIILSAKTHSVKQGRAHLQDHVKREAQIMMECDFPFLVNLVASFKDAERVYLLL